MSPGENRQFKDLVALATVVLTLALIAAGFFMFWWNGRAWRRRERRRAEGRCVRCGYDVTAIPESIVCPECGAAIWR